MYRRIPILSFVIWIKSCLVCAEPQTLANLTVEERICIVNDKTKLQVNLELDELHPSEGFALRGVDFSGFKIGDLHDITIGSTNVMLRANQSVYLVVPVRRIGDRSHVMNLILPEYSAVSLHPFRVGLSLCERLSGNLSCHYPYPYGPLEGPLFIEEPGFDKWPTNALHTMSVQATNATVRELLCTIYNGQRKAYWIVTPADPEPRPGLQELEIGVYCPEDNRSLEVYLERDSRYQEWRKRLFDAKPDPKDPIKKRYEPERK
jgi:hypothetical protein